MSSNWHPNTTAAVAAMLKLYTNLELEDFDFDTEYFETLCDLMGIDSSNIDTAQLFADNCSLLIGYIEARKKEESAVSIKSENAELEKLIKLSGNLREALSKISSVGNAGNRLFSEIDAFADTRDDPDNPNIRMLNGDPVLNPFEGLCAFMDQLQVAAERAKVQKPRPEERPFPDAGDEMFARSHREKILRNFSKKVTKPDPTAHYKGRWAQYAPVPNQALIDFVQHLHQIWSEYSPLPFTEGKYEPDAGQHISRTVDAAMFILEKFQAPYLRSLVENKVREVRELNQIIE